MTTEGAEAPKGGEGVLDEDRDEGGGEVTLEVEGAFLSSVG